MPNVTLPHTITLRNETCKAVERIMRERKVSSIRKAFLLLAGTAQNISQSSRIGKKILHGFEDTVKVKQDTLEKQYSRFKKFIYSNSCENEFLRNLLHLGVANQKKHKNHFQTTQVQAKNHAPVSGQTQRQKYQKYQKYHDHKPQDNNHLPQFPPSQNE